MSHRFHFFRAGGVDQVSLRCRDDLRALRDLDQKLWVALAMPDPFADKGRPWKLYFVIALIRGLAGGWYLGKLDKYLPESARSTRILGKNAPAYEAPPAAAPAAAPTP